jgi:putative tryptophan/tyrosine transport system substrate-binding protein
LITRRHILVAGALGAFLPSSFAQKVSPRVCLFGSIPLAKSALSPMLLQGLAELGYRHGAGMTLEYRFTDGSPERYLAVARELIASKCEVIFAVGNEPPARALRDARTPVPVVFIANDYDPVARGIIDSLRRPGGNITGVFGPTGALAAKRLELAQEILPGKSRFLVLSDRYSKDQLEALRKAAHGRAELTVVEYTREPYDYAAAFDTGRRARAEGFIGLSSPVFLVHRAELSAVMGSHRLPAFVPAFLLSEPGVVASYSYDGLKLARRAAEIGVRILKGTTPADIPVEQPTEYELVVNLKTARALGLMIPTSVLARATKLIE